jgi:hypothetical protein
MARQVKPEFPRSDHGSQFSATAVMIEQRPRQYNTCRPHDVFGFKTPAQVAAKTT